jgi:hypothetical protein
MRFRWPKDTPFQRLQLDVEQSSCTTCGRQLHICCHRRHRLFTLRGPLELLCRQAHCSDPACPARCRTLSPTAELRIALPRWLIGWDVLCWMGQRRFARHWSIPQIQAELHDSYHIPLSPDAIAVYLRRYQTMVAARQQDPVEFLKAYEAIDSLVLSIDGLQPEKGHESLYAVRELMAQRIWFAEALLSSNETEVRRLLLRARDLAQQLGKPIRLWLSDKQDAFVKGIAAEFAGVPHRYCVNHFLRDLAKPTLDADSHAKVQMRHKVRGLRNIEQGILKERNRSCMERLTKQYLTAKDPAASPAASQSRGNGEGTSRQAARTGNGTAVGQPKVMPGAEAKTADERRCQVVLDYCAAVRGILNDDQGGPLSPPGIRMTEALQEVRASLGRNLALQLPGPAHGQLQRLAGCIDRGLAEVKGQQQQVREQVEEIRQVAATVDETTGKLTKRRACYRKLLRQYKKKEGAFYAHLSQLMESFAAGLFVPVRTKRGETLPSDNLDLERWFRQPKGHERRIHGHKHAGVRIVQEGATLLLTLDAHQGRSDPFTADDLLPYRDAEMPPDELEALQRRKVMRKARAKKNG